jgi:hypothetical protein
MGSTSSLAEVLKRIREALKNSKKVVVGQTPPDEEAAAEYLDDAEGDIDLILDPGQAPSLNPTTAGSILSQPQHGNFADCINYQIDFAEEAVAEAEGDNDQYYIGDRIRTIGDHLTETRDLLGGI